MVGITAEQLRWLRLGAQRLSGDVGKGRATVAEIVAAVGGIQAQERPAAALAVRVRSGGLTAESVEEARVTERSVLLTWGLRGTLHLLATEDVGWLLPLLGPGFRAAGRRRRAELGLDEETCARAAGIIGETLAARGPLTRYALAERLAEEKIPVEGQAKIHLIGYAALSGLVCCGPDQGNEPTYVLLNDWVRLGKPLAREAAFSELARRYLAAYGPATPADFAAWSGLARGEVRAGWQGIAGELATISVEGQELSVLKGRMEEGEDAATERACVRLLPRFDTLLLGYRGREWLVAPEYARRVHPGGGILNATLLVDGQVAGTWRTERKGKQLVIVIEPFGELPPEIGRGLQDECGDVGRFLGQDAVMRVGLLCDLPLPAAAAATLP